MALLIIVLSLSCLSCSSLLNNEIGEQKEIRHKLQGYGIPKDLLPLTYSSGVNTLYHSRGIRLRKTLELQQPYNRGPSSSLPSSSSDGSESYYNSDDTSINDQVGGAALFVECPRRNDVMFRKGNSSLNNHFGNVLFRYLIESTHKEHCNAENSKQKVDLTWRIVHEIENQQGRFLGWDKSLKTWFQHRDRAHIRGKVALSYKQYKRGLQMKERKAISDNDSNGDQQWQHQNVQRRHETTNTAISNA
jgi:hypothetical protein